MERTLISWNFPNWFTVTLMASLGFVGLAIIAQLLRGGPLMGGGAGGY